MQQDNKLAS